jgi:cell division protease FtsH
LDSALLRPGRFDKTIHVSPPKSKEDREAIVAVHSKGKTFEDGVTVEKIAKQCYGLTGAEIASALNDAVLESFKADRNGIISLDDIDKAIMKLFAKGLAKGRHSEKDMYRVAVHEAGHAVMNKAIDRSVVKVSIQPYSSGVGGVTQVDGENSGLDGLMTKTDIINSIKVLYAGKVAEEIILGECSVGASNDLERATYAIRDYIGTYGMKEDNLLSLVGLARENMMITANEKLLQDMQKVAEEIYADVVKYFAKEEIQQIIKNLSDYLVEYEVIYDFDLAYEQAKNNEPIVLEKHSLTDVDKANEIALEKKVVEEDA